MQHVYKLGFDIFIFCYNTTTQASGSVNIYIYKFYYQNLDPRKMMDMEPPLPKWRRQPYVDLPTFLPNARLQSWSIETYSF